MYQSYVFGFGLATCNLWLPEESELVEDSIPWLVFVPVFLLQPVFLSKFMIHLHVVFALILSSDRMKPAFAIDVIDFLWWKAKYWNMLWKKCCFLKLDTLAIFRLCYRISFRHDSCLLILPSVRLDCEPMDIFLFYTSKRARALPRFLNNFICAYKT